MSIPTSVVQQAYAAQRGRVLQYALSCYDEDALLERSKRLKRMFELALKTGNVQLGFPLYPVYTAHDDAYCTQFGNSGFFGYLCLNAWQFAKRWSSEGGKGMRFIPTRRPYKTLQDFKLQFGLPYELLYIGSPIEVRQYEHPNRRYEVRIIQYKRNPLFFQGECPLVPPTTPPQHQRSDKKESKSKQEKADMKPLEGGGIKSLASVECIPIVSAVMWRQLNLMLSQRYDRTVQTILINSLWVPEDELDASIAEVLSDPENDDIVERYRSLRAQLNDPTNPAYMEAMITALLSYLTANMWVPSFAKVFETARGQDTVSIQDPYVDPIWSQYLVMQHTQSYYKDFLAMSKELDVEVLFAHMFQICFALDFAQNVLGFVHHNLNVRCAIGFLKSPPNHCLFYQWAGHTFKVPTFGKILKIGKFERSSIIVGGKRHTSNKAIETRSSEQLGPDTSDNFNVDLIRLAGTMRAVLREKDVQLVAKKRHMVDDFLRMLHSWTTCFNDPEVTDHKSDLEINLVEHRNKCIEADDVGNNCEWKSFFDIPTHLECPKALPRAQIPFFKMFDVTEKPDQIPRNPPPWVYTLP